MDEFRKIMALIRQKTGTLILGGVLAGALSFAFLVASQDNFKVTTQFLVVQDQATGPQDFFSLSKSVDYNGKVMSEAVYSELFIDEVVKTGKVDEEFLPFNKKDRIKEWSKMIGVGRDPQLGLITISVFNDSQNEALDISNGIIQVLDERSFLFRGSGQDIDFRVISGPILDKNPSVAQMSLAVLGGIVIGIAITLVLSYYRKEEEKGDELLKMIANARAKEGIAPISLEEYEQSLKNVERK